MGFVWPPHGRRQCWKIGFPASGTWRAFTQLSALGEGTGDGRWAQAQLGFHKYTHQPTSLLQNSSPPFIGHRLLRRLFTILPLVGRGTFSEYPYASPNR
jgi:hypothetical protein